MGSQYLAPSNSTAVNSVDPELGASSTLYEQKRPRRDNAFTIIYCILAAFTFFGSFATFAKSDKDLAQYTSAFYEGSISCDVDSFDQAQALKPTDPVYNNVSDTFTARYALGVSIWMPISAICGIAFAICYVLLFIRAAIKMVYFSIYVPLVFSMVVGIISLAAGAIPSGIISIGLAVIVAVIYWFMRDQLELCAKLLAVAGKGLFENGSLVTASLLIQIGGAGVLVYMFAAFICGIFVGSVGKNSAAVTRIGTDAAGACYDSAGMQVSCCTWNTEGWAGFYCFVSLLMCLWTVQLVMQIRLYVVAGTISAWYFCPEGATPGSPEYPSVRRSFSHAMTSSFGSVAFAAIIMTAIEMIREALRRAARDNIICCIINCIAQPILALCEQFTRFATIACAITGLAFVDSAKHVFGVLKRNFLSTYSVWYVPNMVLNMSCFLGSIMWAMIVYFATWIQFRGDAEEDVVGLCFAVSMTCFGLMLFILMFVAHLLLDIVNTVYVCFAMDRDAQRVTHSEIHEVYMALPPVKGALIQNPDGGLAYGAGEAPQQQQQQYGTSLPQQYSSIPQQGAFSPYPQQGYSTQGYPTQAYPPQAYPPQAYPPQAYPPQGFPTQGYSPQYPTQQPPGAGVQMQHMK